MSDSPETPNILAKVTSQGPEGADRWSRHLAMINEVGKKALSSLDVHALLNGVAEAIQKGFAYYDVSVFLVEFESGECVLTAQAGAYVGKTAVGYRQKLGVGIVGWVAQHGETAVVNDVSKDPRFLVAFAEEAHSRSELAVPIRLERKTLGVINVENRQRDAFDERDVTALETISDQVAQAVANARLFSAAQTLSELSKSIVDTIPSALCILDEDLKIVSANRGFVAAFARGEDALVGRALSEFWPQQTLDTVQLEDAVRRAIENVETVTLSNLHMAPGADADSAWVEQGERILNMRLCGMELPEGRRALLVVDDVTAWRAAETRAVRSVQQIELLMASAPIGINSLDSNGTFTYWSSGSERVFGYAADEVVGSQTLALLAPSGLDWQATLERTRHEGEVESETRMRRKDGSLVPIHCMFVPLRNAAGEQTGYTVSFLDITERQRAQEALLQEKGKLEKVMDVVGAGLALIDRDFNITWANRRISEWFGGDPIGRKCYRVYCHRDQVCRNCAVQEVFRTGQPAESQDTAALADGSYHYFHRAAAPILDASGQVVEVLEVSQDVTDYTKKEYQLARLRQLGEAMQGVLQLDVLLRRILTYVTAGQALGFNRAVLLLLDEDQQCLVGELGVGPESYEDASRIWREIAERGHTLHDLLEAGGEPNPADDQAMCELARRIRVPLSETSSVVVRAVLDKKPYVVDDAFNDEGVSPGLAGLIGAKEFVVVPLVARGRALGAVIADKRFSSQPITPEHVELLSMFAAQAGLAIENAESYRSIESKMKELEEAYRDLAETQDKLIVSERLAAVGRMAAHVAHEIRNPLVTIGGFARALQAQPPDPERYRRSVEIIVKEVRGLEQILADVMDFTRPGRPVVQKRNLNEVVEQTVELVADRAEREGIRLTVQLADALPDVSIDAGKIKQVILNLLQNGLDAAPAGGEVSVTTQPTAGGVRLCVANTGDPIPEDQMGDVFEPFFTTKPGGTGLGLAASQKIVQDHGGDISVTSSAEEGTRFTVTLPLDGPKSEERRQGTGN